MFDICTHDLSELFWKRLLRLSAWNVEAAVSAALPDGDAAELDRDDMTYKTGSIPLATAVWLTLLAQHLKPKRAYEVGTFIGKSTRALAYGMAGGQIWTCDASNPAPESLESESHESETIINLHPMTTSTQMFAAMDAEVSKGDLFFFDGRIMPDDLPHIARLSHERTVYAFDDFEGCEKGVANASMLGRRDMRLIYPPAPELLAPLGVLDRSTLALLVPTAMFRMTAQ